MILETYENLRYLDAQNLIDKSLEISQNSQFRSDAKLLSVILNNLVANSIKYHNPRKENPYIKVIVNYDEDRLHLMIKDNGSGITEDQLPKIFQMFYQASEASTGSGLGLYIVKETIEKLGGDIVVHSDVKKGTTFDITLPAK